MHLKVQKRKGREYLSVVQSYRQGGRVKTRTVETIGYADAYAGEYADPVAHFRAYVEQLNEQAAANNQPVALSFKPDAVIDAAAAPSARLGSSIALGCLDAIGVRDFFQPRAGHDGFPTHAGRVFEMLAVERMMHATSKRESWTARASFPRACDFTFEDVYAALPCFAREEERLEASLFQHWERVHGTPDTNRIYVPCGAYSFPDGGANKHACVAVALDAQGMPLGYRAVMGRMTPHALRGPIDALKERVGAKQAVVIAAAQREPEASMAELVANGDGFVMFQPSVAPATELAHWIQDDEGYREMGAGVHMKWRDAARDLPGVGSTPVREVVLTGGGYALRQGRALLVTNDMAMPPAQVIQLFRELWRQAEPFQPLEADFSAMPVPVSAHDHIRAHFAICYAAFFALRALRWKTGWQHNAADTADALLRMEGVHLQQNYYLFNYRTAVTDDIENAVGISPARRLRTRAALRSVPGTVRQAFG